MNSLGSLAELAHTVTGYHTKSDIAHAVLREAILLGVLRPNEPITTQRVANELNMSGTPVREAFRRLEQEQLIYYHPHIGATVRDIPANYLEENLLMRKGLEGVAAKLAAPLMTEEVLSNLQALIDEMDRCTEADPKHRERYARLNREFHLTVYRVLPYKRLYRTIESLWQQLPRTYASLELHPVIGKESQAGHRELLSALREGDGARAEEITRRQKQQAIDALEHQHAEV